LGETRRHVREVFPFVVRRNNDQRIIHR
jgi:hypothetical protein